MARAASDRSPTSSRSRGVELDWNPDRPLPGTAPLKHEDLARLVRSFMSHVKSNSLTREDLEQRLAARTPTPARPRPAVPGPVLADP